MVGADGAPQPLSNTVVYAAESRRRDLRDSLPYSRLPLAAFMRNQGNLRVSSP